MKLAIVTGVSRGLGESIAKIFMKSGIHVVGISRSVNSQLAEAASQNQVQYKHYACDLAELTDIENLLPDISEFIKDLDLTNLYVVNNAALIEPINQASKIEPKQLARHMQVNAVAPMVMMNYFLNEVTVLDTNLVGVNITSGAAENPYYGWSAYCSSKASINMYTKTVALEQAENNTGNKIIAFSPGIMDTDMQGEIRSSSRDAFMDIEKFRGYKENNQLRDANEVGHVIVDILTDEVNIENGKIYTVQDYL